MTPVIRISPKSLRVVRKRIGLTPQTRWLSNIEVHTPRLLFVYFSQLSPPRTFQAHFSVDIFLSDTVVSFTVLKEIHSRAAQKQDLFNI